MIFKQLLEQTEVDLAVRSSDNMKVERKDFKYYYDCDSKLEVKKEIYSDGEFNYIFFAIIYDNVKPKQITQNDIVNQCLEKRRVSACSKCCRYSFCPDARKK